MVDPTYQSPVPDPSSPWPAVVAMSGLPFAGKSTLSRVLAERLGARLIEVDQLIEREEPDEAGPIPDRLWFAAYRRAEALVRLELAAGRRAIYDGVNFRWVQREKLRRLARKYGQRTLMVHVTTPLETNLARQRANHLQPTRPAVDPDTFKMVRDRFEPPRTDEWAVAYDGTEPVEAWLDRVGATLADPWTAAMPPG